MESNPCIENSLTFEIMEPEQEILNPNGIHNQSKLSKLKKLILPKNSRNCKIALLVIFLVVAIFIILFVIDQQLQKFPTRPTATNISTTNTPAVGNINEKVMGSNLLEKDQTVAFTTTTEKETAVPTTTTPEKKTVAPTTTEKKTVASTTTTDASTLTSIEPSQTHTILYSTTKAISRNKTYSKVKMFQSRCKLTYCKQRNLECDTNEKFTEEMKTGCKMCQERICPRKQKNSSKPQMVLKKVTPTEKIIHKCRQSPFCHREVKCKGKAECLACQSLLICRQSQKVHP